MPGVFPDAWSDELSPLVKEIISDNTLRESFILDRHLNTSTHKITGHEGPYLLTVDGKRIYDATGGAAVSCLNQGSPELRRKINKAVELVRQNGSYMHSALFSVPAQEAFAADLIKTTGGQLHRVMILSSGSEATEAAIKLAIQYHQDKSPEGWNCQRVKIITRDGSYHGNTLGALSISGHLARRQRFESQMSSNHYRVSACNPYRQQLPNESDASYVARKAAELDAKFEELGPDTVAAFMCEPVVGAALGAMPAVPGYLQAMKDICHKHGALFILDEVMCGMGRCGTTHCWQEEGVVPDIQTVGKGLAGGFAPVAALLIHEKVVKVIQEGTGYFLHGQTYQNHPVNCATALTVQNHIAENNLVANVRQVGPYLGRKLNLALGSHRYVGNIRGKGFLWGIELVKNKSTRAPFPREENVAEKIRAEAYKQDMAVYPGQGCADDYWSGDLILLAPAFTTTEADVDFIATRLRQIVDTVFEDV